MDLRLLRYFVAVVEERHIGRAAVRLHMTQPPLSRAVRQLENEMGSRLLERTAGGVEPTAAGEVLYAEAVELLAHAEKAALRVSAATRRVLRLGTLADSAVRTGPDIAERFLRDNAAVEVSVHEADFTDPSAGLRRGRVDLALTRLPFDTEGLAVLPLRSDHIGVVTRSDDPIAGAVDLTSDRLAGRRLPRFPDGADPLWEAYWSVGQAVDPAAPVIRTPTEFMQFVQWGLGIGVAPLGGRLPDGVAITPLRDVEPSRMVLAWRRDDRSPLIEAFVRTASAAFPDRPRG